MKTSRIALLTAVIIVAAVSGSWFMLSPSLEKQDNLNKQTELLDSMVSDVAVIVDETITAQAVDFHDEPITEIDDATPPETELVTEPEIATEPVTETPGDAAITGIGILTIDKIDLELPVVDGVSEEQLEIAVGRVPQTAAIGELGNAVIAGHRSYTYGDYFNRLGEVETGDIIGYTPKDGESMRFEVFEITEIEPGDQIAFVQPEDEAIITLYTCTPVRTATHRLLVRARKI